MQLSPVSHRSLDDLESAIISHAQRMNVFEYEFLLLVREFDVRQGWKAWHLNNCAQWLNMHCGIQESTGREKVRVALALLDLPQISDAFATGLLSYSKVRSLTRVAARHDEEDLLKAIKRCTASRVDDYCRQLRNANRCLSTPDANRLHKARYLSCSHQSDGGSTIHIELPREQSDLIMKAIEIAGIELDNREDHAQLKDDSYFAKQADALMMIVQSYLGGGSDKATSTADHYQVIVHVDEAALRDEAGKSDLPVESVRRIACDASVIEVTEDANGEPLNVGRKHRVVSPPLKRALLSRDRCCRFPGCTHDKWLDAHHVKHWIDGGETSLANTMLICSKHHRLLHEGEFTIHNDFEDKWYFRNNTGKIIPEAPAVKVIDYDDDEIDFETALAILLKQKNPPRGGCESVKQHTLSNGDSSP